MSGRVWVAVSLLAGILEEPGLILDGDIKYATYFSYFTQLIKTNTGTYKHRTKMSSFYSLQNSQAPAPPPLLADIT
jgi:hypothetical protein